MHTLVEATYQIEGLLPVEEGEELEKLVFPACGEICNHSGYKAKMCVFVAQKPTRVAEEEKIAPTVELRGGR